MAIRYVGFVQPVSCGNLGSITNWSETKHGRTISVAEKGPWLILTLADKSRRRIPLVNVAFIHDDDGPAVPMRDLTPTIEAA